MVKKVILEGEMTGESKSQYLFDNFSIKQIASIQG